MFRRIGGAAVASCGTAVYLTKAPTHQLLANLVIPAAAAQRSVSVTALCLAPRKTPAAKGKPTGKAPKATQAKAKATKKTAKAAAPKKPKTVPAKKTAPAKKGAGPAKAANVPKAAKVPKKAEKASTGDSAPTPPPRQPAGAVAEDLSHASDEVAPRVPTKLATPIITREEPATYVPMERESLAEYVQRRTAEAESVAERSRRRADAAKAASITPRQAERTRVAMRQLMQHHFAAEQIARKRRERESSAAVRALDQQRQSRLNLVGMSVPDLDARQLAQDRLREEAREAARAAEQEQQAAQSAPDGAPAAAPRPEAGAVDSPATPPE